MLGPIGLRVTTGRNQLGSSPTTFRAPGPYLCSHIQWYYAAKKSTKTIENDEKTIFPYPPGTRYLTTDESSLTKGHRPALCII